MENTIYWKKITSVAAAVFKAEIKKNEDNVREYSGFTKNTRNEEFSNLISKYITLKKSYFNYMVDNYPKIELPFNNYVINNWFEIKLREKGQLDFEKSIDEEIMIGVIIKRFIEERKNFKNKEGWYSAKEYENQYDKELVNCKGEKSFLKKIVIVLGEYYGYRQVEDFYRGVQTKLNDKEVERNRKMTQSNINSDFNNIIRVKNFNTDLFLAAATRENFKGQDEWVMFKKANKEFDESIRLPRFPLFVPKNQKENFKRIFAGESISDKVQIITTTTNVWTTFINDIKLNYLENIDVNKDFYDKKINEILVKWICENFFVGKSLNGTNKPLKPSTVKRNLESSGQKRAVNSNKRVSVELFFISNNQEVK